VVFAKQEVLVINGPGADRFLAFVFGLQAVEHTLYLATGTISTYVG
jgi:hypothetical protein